MQRSMNSRVDVTLKTVAGKTETRKRTGNRANATGRDEGFKGRGFVDARFGVLGGTFR